jgi:two-component system sensor histidine kinase/response regulator
VPETAVVTVLLVEDDRVNQRVAAAMLRHLGFHVDVVTDGAQAVAAAASTAYRAILMDCQIPVLDGYEATGEIRRAEGTSRRTPIVAVTASDSVSDRQRCLAAGMDDYLSKPVSLRSLTAVLGRWTSDGSGGGGGPVGSANPPAPLQPAPTLDPEVVERLTRLGESVGDDLMGQLTVVYLHDADARIALLHEALDTGDAGAVVQAAHTLGGASAHLGALAMTRLCASMSSAGKAGDLRGGGGILEAIEAELERVRSALAPPLTAGTS